MAKNSKIDKKKRVINTLCVVVGSLASSKGLDFLNEQDFMTKQDDPSKKKYKPLIAASGVFVGSIAGAVFIPNEYLSSVMSGMAAGSSNKVWDEAAAQIKGIGAAPKGDVQKFLNLYADLSKGQANNNLKF